MLLRRDRRGVLAIGQPAHALISGQLARAWGNDHFGAVEPREEVCLAAEQHDIGMAAWDADPSFNPRTRLPHAFTEMPLQVHLELWREAPRRLLRQSRHAALLCSMHGVRLYQMRDLERMPDTEADAVRAMIAAQRELQDGLLRSLHADAATAADVAPERLARNSDLLWTWDYLSLALCLEWAPCTARGVPSAQGAVELALTPGAGGVCLDPWPFAPERLVVRCEGQRLKDGYANENELRAALASSPWETLPIALTPARSA